MSQQIGARNEGRTREAATEEPAENLVRGRLIVALDALLKTGSATLAARRLGLQTPAISRMLAQLRELLNDPIFIRSGRGLVPTALAEEIRPIVASVVEGIEATFERGFAGDVREAPFDSSWDVRTALPVAALAVRPANLLEGEPSPRDIERKLSRIDRMASPHTRLAKALATISTATGHRRPLTPDEAKEAMGIILAGEADPVQIGAFMSILQFRNVTAGELAGFVEAARAHVKEAFQPRRLKTDLDWPCYVSPNQQNPPWFLHAACLVARAGYRVLLHGSSGAGEKSGRLEFVANALTIPVCRTAADTARALAEDNIAYVPLAAYAPQIYRLLALHSLTGHRSPIRNAAYLINLANADASLFGVAQSAYKDLHRDTAKMLDFKDITILGNIRDFAQFTPFRATVMYRLVGGETLDTRIAPIAPPPAQPRPRTTSIEYWNGIWTGAVVEERVEKIILATAAAAFMTLARDSSASFDEAYQRAEGLWRKRHAKR